jgi:formylmethanofuran dehydrogenase subunit C
LSALTFTLKEKPAYLVDCSPLSPDRLQGKRRSQIESIKLIVGNRKVPAKSLFEISGTDATQLSFRRSCDRLNHLGAGMTQGSMEIRGPVGDHLGRNMAGGHISVRGNAGAWTGSGMTGGRIDVLGDVGDFLGAAFPGDVHGMNSGDIFVSGNAGARVGDRMRRGLVVIEGNAGDYCGSRMLAGTIVVLGRCGVQPGFGMKRGTIVLKEAPREALNTLGYCGTLKLEVLRLLRQQLPSLNRRLRFVRSFKPLARRYVGDFAVQGKGEILILVRRHSPRRPE